jgi:hypothetical protein
MYSKYDFTLELEEVNRTKAHRHHLKQILVMGLCKKFLFWLKKGRTRRRKMTTWTTLKSFQKIWQHAKQTNLEHGNLTEQGPMSKQVCHLQK